MCYRKRILLFLKQLTKILFLNKFKSLKKLFVKFLKKHLYIIYVLKCISEFPSLVKLKKNSFLPFSPRFTTFIYILFPPSLPPSLHPFLPFWLLPAHVCVWRGWW